MKKECAILYSSLCGDESYRVSFLSRDARWSRTSPFSLWKTHKGLSFDLQHSSIHIIWPQILLCLFILIYLWSSLSRWARGASSSRATWITLRTEHKHTSTHTIRQSLPWVGGLTIFVVRPHTLSPSDPGGPRSPKPPGWPSGPYKTSNTYHL